MTQEHGWLLPDLVRLETAHRGRWELWKYTMKSGEIEPQLHPISFLQVGDPGFEDGLQMVLGCLQAIPKYWQSADSRLLYYLVDWLLFAVGHPSVRDAPPEIDEGASKRLMQAIDLDVLVKAPADYFGHILAGDRYGQWGAGKFYPTWQNAACLMATTAAHTAIAQSEFMPPFRGFEPCIGSGRLCLELSNWCRALTGWEWDSFLLRVSIVNFMLYAPDFAVPIPALGGDLIRGDSLTGYGESVITGRQYREGSITPTETIAPTPVVRKKKSLNNDRYQQGMLF